MSILTSHMMVTKNPQNVHRNYFWAILLTFIFDINICELSLCQFFFLWTSSIVCMFDFLIFDIFLTTWHLFDILTHQLNLNHLSLHRAIFLFSALNFVQVSTNGSPDIFRLQSTDYYDLVEGVLCQKGKVHVYFTETLRY